MSLVAVIRTLQVLVQTLQKIRLEGGGGVPGTTERGAELTGGRSIELILTSCLSGHGAASRCK